jgi:hypothetical protein
MALPDELRRVLAVGTINMTTLPHTPISMDSVVDKIEGRLEAQVLLKVAEHTLKQQAGYIVHHDHRPLAQPCPQDDGHLISTISVQHFLKMLRGQPTYKELLPEWCIHTGLLKLHIPPELLPDILQHGQRYEDLRQHLGLLLGRRGVWLAQEITNQNWKWALEIKTTDPRAVLETQRWRETEIMDLLKTQSIDNTHTTHKGLQQLQNYRVVWSKVLADVLIDALESANIIQQQPSYMIMSILDLCGYYFPIAQSSRLLFFLAQGEGAWRTKMNELETSFKFRHDIFAELYQTAEQ